MKKRIDWFGVVVICTVLLWLAWGAVATAAPRVAGNALIVHSQDSGTFPTPGVMNFNGILGDIDGGLWTQDGYRGWVRLCSDVNGLGCADAGTVKVVTGTLPIRVVNDGGGGYDISLDTSVLDAGLVKVITGTLPVKATWDAGGGYNLTLEPGYITGILPIVATSDGGGGYAISFNASNFDAGLVKVITGTLPVVAISDAGGGYDIALAPGYITGILPVIATSDGGGGYAIGMSTAACTGTYAALQYDAGFYCAQLAINIPDSGYVSVTGTAPITVTPDAGGGYNVSLDKTVFHNAWHSYCVGSLTNCQTNTSPFLGIFYSTAAYGANKVTCNTTFAGSGAGNATINVREVGGSVLSTCTIACTSVVQTGASCSLSGTLTGGTSYELYVEGSCTIPNMYCIVDLNHTN